MYEHDVCFVLIYNEKLNKYTANILTAAIESSTRFIKVYLMQIDKGLEALQDLLILNHKCRKVVVGITFMTTQIEDVLNVVPRVRALLPKALLVAGGPHATGDPYGTLTKLGFDIVVYGEGEATLIDLLDAVDNNNDVRVCGTAYIEDDNVVITRRSPIDLDAYPPFPFWRGRFNPIEIMRGCSSACYFCQVTYSFGMPRYRSIENVIHYSRIKLEKGLKDLRFIAPNSFGYGSKDGIKPNIVQLTELLYKLRNLVNQYKGRIFFGTFPSEVRPDSVEEDIVKEVRKLVDNKRIIVGVQSGSPNVLEKINRKYTVEDAINAVEILKKNGFEVDVDLILGFRFESDEDIRHTLDLINRLVALNARIHLHTFIPLPGTPLFSAGFKPISSTVKKYLVKLVGEGKVYGYWLRQEEIAEKIERYKEEGFIHDFYSYKNKLKFIRC